MGGFVRDLQVAGRALHRRRVFSLAWIANFALGIAGFTLVLSVVSRALLRPLPYPHPGQLVAAYQVIPDLRERMPTLWNAFGFSYDAFRSLQRDVPAFDVVAAFAGGGSRVASLTPNEPLERLDVLRVSGSAFTLLGVRPARGRAFLPSEESRPGTPVAVISHELWQTRFGSRDDILDLSITLNNKPHRIVGVLPQGFNLVRGTSPPVWIPIGSDPDDALPRKTPLSIVARLRPGASAETAAIQVARVLQTLDPGQGLEARVVSWQAEVTRRTRRPLLLFTGASVVLLLLAVVSVSGLFAIELQSRFREFATRMAIGARRQHIARQLCAEAVLLALLASALGAWLAATALPPLRALGAGILPPLRVAQVDVGVLGAVLLLAFLVALILALGAAISVTSRSPAALMTPMHFPSRRRGRRLTGYTMVGVQFALACFLLIGASLLAVNLRRVAAVDPGFNPHGKIVLSVEAGSEARLAETAVPVFTRIAHALGRLPRVGDVTIASAIPFSGGNSSGSLAVEHAGGVDTITARFSSTLPGFIEALGLRLVAGRTLGEEDRRESAPVAVVNETLARRYWRGADAIGRVVSIGDSRFTVAGVVSDVRHSSMVDSTWPTVYVAEQQSHSRFLQLLVRLDCEGLSSHGCATATGLDEIRRAVSSVAPTVLVNTAQWMPTLVSRSFEAERFGATVIGAFAAFAFVLTLFGAYGTTARAVQLARKEVAIRIALGATSASAIGGFARKLGLVALAGALAGAAAALYASNGVRPFLSLVSAVDPAVYLTAVAALTAVALLTAALAARAIERIDPASVLKDA